MFSQNDLNPEQSEAVEFLNGPLLIIAGAGTGKTRTIISRIVNLITKRHVKPQEILALTFTEKAAVEMQERVDMVMPYGYTEMWISTFHSFCDRLLRLEAIHIGLDSSYKLMTEAETINFLQKHLFEFDLNYFRPLGNPNKFLQAMLQHFSRLKDEDVSPDQYIDWVKNQKDTDGNEGAKNIELANAFEKYEELKTKEGVMDFSDLVSNALKLFRLRKNILKQYQEQFRHILVDEFQDTNYAQNELSMLLAGEQKNITVVGDDDQAIYRWRGAAISNMIQFKTRFKKAKIITLTKNYRSTQNILDTSYKMIQNNNPDRLEVKEGINKKLTSLKNKEGSAIEFMFSSRVENEADLVVKKIQKLLKQKKYEYKDFAILVRANDHAQAFIQSLTRQNIPYQFLGPGQLFHQEEIKDLIAYLKVLYNFQDSASLYRILHMPIFNISTKVIAALLNLAKKKNKSLFETLEILHEVSIDEDSKKSVSEIYKMILKHLERVHKDTAGQILYLFLTDSGLLKKMATAEKEIDVKISQNIAKFFEKLKTYETDHEDASVFAVADWIDLSMQLGESPLAADIDWSENNAVNILTIHSSKGLEFANVFLVNLVTGRFPTRKRKETIPIPQALINETLPEGDFHLQEERRLFYVGMTRACDNLFLSASNFYGEGKRERKISPFVYESVGEKNVEEKLNSKVASPNQLSLLDWQSKDETDKSKKDPTTNYKSPITYLSYSQIQTFDICPLHYKLKYILKIPTPFSPAQSFGSSIHAALRDFYQDVIKGKKATPEDISEYIQKSWINEGYTSKTFEKTAFEQAKKILIHYAKNNFDPQNKPIALELPFQFFVSNNLKLGGRIDRIDKIDREKIEIIDYKTGTNIPKEKDIIKDQQLTFYALAAMNVRDQFLNKKPQDVILSLHYLELDKKISTTRTLEQLEIAKKEIREKAQEISQSEFLCSGNMLCQNCEYKILCSTN